MISLKEFREVAELPQLPSFLQFETSSRCCGLCANCPNSPRECHPDGSITSRVLYKRLVRGEPFPGISDRIVDELTVSPGLVDTVAPFLYEDPWLNPTLINTLSRLKSRGIKTLLYSTMVNPNCQDLFSVVYFGILDELHVSCHGWDDSSWSKWHGYGKSDYGRAIGNIAFLKEVRRVASDKTRPKIIFNYMLRNDTIPYIHIARQNHAHLFDEFWPIAYDDFHGTYSWLAPEKHKPDTVYPCQRLFNGLNVFSDGCCTPCCIDFAEELSLGDLSETQTMKEIYNSESAWEFRYSCIARGAIPNPCKTCNIPWTPTSQWKAFCDKYGFFWRY